MAYGIWLYKEITTSNGVIRLEIKKKNYTGESIEIEALLKDGLTLQVDGRDITDPIIGTTLSISLIDTGQIDTSQFFTPDATLYQVVLYRDSVRIWIGYLTPDSYSENLVYSDVINLTARDNLGRLNDFIYDKSEGLQAVYQFIESLCERASISMPLVFYSGITAKRIAESEVDTSLRGVAASVDTLRFVGMNYREIVEMILKGIGCQMRYSYNTDRGYFLGVYDISQLYSELSTQEAFFVEKSGYKEIKPAWREVLIEQDYGLSSNLFDGYFSKDELAGAETFLPEDIDNNRWGGDGSMLFCNQYLAKVDDFQSTSLFIAADRSESYCFYRKNVFKSDNVLTLKMQLNNTLRMMPSYVSDYDTIGNLYVGYHIESDPDLQPVQYFETYTLKYKFNVYLVGRDTGITYVMRDKWIPLSEDDAEPITFEMAQVWYNDPSLWDRIEQVEIVVNSTPEDGELRLVVYAAEGAAIAPLSTIHQTTFAKISNIEIAYQNDIQGASSRIEVNAAHNLKSNINLEIGQVPNNKGNNLAYWGGLFDSAGYPLNSWVLNDGDIVRYNLMELVARQHIHQNSKNYALLSGVMMSDSALSLTNNITYKGKVYSILSASHNLINGKMNVTSMQEIEAYQVAELTVIDSPLESSSGTRLGSGDNEVIQFSNDAGNAKRIYELDSATDEDKEESYVIIDKGSLDSARRIPLTDVGGLWKKDANGDVYLIDNNGESRGVYGIGKLRMGTLILPNESGTEGDYELYVGALGAGSDTPEGGGGGIAQVTINVNGSPYKTDANGVVTLPNYPTIPTWNTLEGKPTLAAVATSGAYSDLSGAPNLGSLAYKSSLAASDIPDLSGSYLPLSGGTLQNGTSTAPLILNTTSSTEIGIKLNMSDVNKGWVGYSASNGYGTYLFNSASNKYIGIKDDGTPHYQGNTLIHSGNIGDQAVYKADRAEKLVYSDGTIGLQVLSGGVIKPSNRIAFDDNTTGICKGAYYTSALSHSDIVIAAPKIVFYEGNVLIGTTTDSGGKLQVDGTIKATSANFGGNSGINIGMTYTDSTSGAYDLIERRSAGTMLYFQYNHNGGVNLCNGGGAVYMGGNLSVSGNISASGYQLPTSAPSNPVSGGYYLYVGSLGAGATIS